MFSFLLGPLAIPCKPRCGEENKREGKEEGRKASPSWEYTKSLVDLGTSIPSQFCRS